ncbi:lipoprotein insertase outer membrane protein LolB [Luteimonas sp. RD2P54]|uniref:Outer-membrane lipoprotein LolB n=1 Tax=Luteimonas endophytica TaxID=3042023 RepID=A0ABT6J5T1_9GAMM|nr:lipoprotein insertase outer membrane protein LolB [Luteimonas endophytica]MDH5822124.1 lipoprotein insertase outer membrane protein LolB [Luteimonas endophytica]
MSARAWAGALLAALLLAGCASRPARTPQPVALGGAALAAATARVEAREMRLRAAPRIGFIGRVALSNGRDGGNGRIEWSQAGGAYRVVLSAPVTRQSWSLTGDAGGARIEGLEGGPRAGADVEALLLEATGMRIPVGAMSAWAAGTRADPGAFGPARLHFDAAGTLVRIEQGGWTIDYQAWAPGAAPPGGADWPQRISARQGDARVRLIVDEWTVPAPREG